MLSANRKGRVTRARLQNYESKLYHAAAPSPNSSKGIASTCPDCHGRGEITPDGEGGKLKRLHGPSPVCDNCQALGLGLGLGLP